ncbi:rRNA pseudouridine synthase, partial [Paracoccus liaowanqingii]
MSDDQIPDRKTPQTAPRTDADRIAKVMARAGIASRREAERMIVEGRVSVNGKKIDSPALDVSPTDRITVDGKKLEDPQETRMWLYYKPLGLITSENDELGRQTVFDALPRDMPRVMTIGRLDLNSEGLLLLTNDGELKRRLELPSTGWLRRYRVRVNGTPSDMTFDPLRRGVTIEGEDFSPMEIKLDSQQGANAWISVGIREGKNREIRRAMAHVGLQVNRLIRIGYGPFKLTGIDKNQVIEVKRKVMRDQLGGLLTGEVEDKPREMRPRGAEGSRGPRFEGAPEAGPRRFGAKPAFAGKPGGRG